MDILDILKGYEVSIPEDKLEEFKKQFHSSYKSSVEVKKIKDELNSTKSKADGVDDLESRLAELQAKYDTDVKKYQTELSEINYNANLTKALDGIEFSNKRVRDSVIGEIKAKNFDMADEKKFKESVDGYMKDLYKSEPDSFKSVNNEIHTWAGGSESGTGSNKGLNDFDPFSPVHL